MHIPIPVPIGVVHSAAVAGAVWRLVSCAHCRQDYAYLLELEASAAVHDLLFLEGEGAAERARAKAEHNLLQKSRNVVMPVPCPGCGCYQEDMARLLKEDKSINRVQIVGLVIALAALVPLALSIPYIWVLSIVLGLAGVALVIWGCVLALRFDPNSGDPEPRKAQGRRHAVWGAELAELLAAHPPAASFSGVLAEASQRTWMTW
jgi:hypothetical protein